MYVRINSNIKNLKRSRNRLHICISSKETTENISLGKGRCCVKKLESSVCLLGHLRWRSTTNHSNLRMHGLSIFYFYASKNVWLVLL